MICWLDLETTGLDERNGSILEIAMLLTDDDLREVSRFQSLVRPGHMRGREVMDGFVVDMHRKSGLLAEIYKDPEDTYSGSLYALKDELPRCGMVEAVAVDWIKGAIAQSAAEASALKIATIVTPEKALKATPLGGNSVHFDRAWIREHMPDLERLFSHRNIDCSTVNELAKRWCSEVHADRPHAGRDAKHRALDDVLASIELARYYGENVFGPAGALPVTMATPEGSQR